MALRLPYNWDARDYQIPIWRALDQGTRRLVAVWHRRAGKDLTLLNRTVIEAHRRVGVYYHMLPALNQARKVVWDGIDGAGRPFLDYVPKEILRSKNEVDMQLEFKNRSIIQFVGSDNYNNLMGTNPVGIVFSEFSMQDPRAWDFFRPILRENGGWAAFLFTPRGRNHGYDLYTMALKNPDWFAERLTIDDTGVLTAADMDEERRSGMSEEMIQQEFYCSFESPQTGAYYGKLMTEAREAGRVNNVPHDPGRLVYTFWDLGVSDSMVIWFCQFVGQEIHLIDYYEGDGYGFSHYADLLQARRDQFGYKYSQHWAPWDIEAREISTGQMRKEAAALLGIDFNVVPMHLVHEGIEATRRIFHRLWIDETRCVRGIRALESYRRKYNEKLCCFDDKPVHDEFSHGADGMRCLAMALREGAGIERRYAADDYDPWERSKSKSRYANL